MILWILSFVTAGLSIPCFSPVFRKLRSHFFQARTIEENKKAIAHLRLLKECLESGQVPALGDWEETARLPLPWGPLFAGSIADLRKQGAPILPSLERMILCLREEQESLLEAKMRSSQAFGQVMISAGMVPFFACILYFLLPALEKEMALFATLAGFSWMLSFGAFFWMLLMMEDARHGRISHRKRSWLLSSKIFFERMIADISTGNPPDLAWTAAVEFLRTSEPGLLETWGIQLWDRFPECRAENPAEVAVIQFGTEIRRTVQQSIVEGRGSLDRLDAVYRNYLFDLKMKISRELQVLPNQCLKPLFLLVLPGVLLLLFGSMAISFAGAWV